MEGSRWKVFVLKTEEIENAPISKREKGKVGGISGVLADMVGTNFRISGVYCIEHISGRKYVGSSADIGKRWRHHLNDLKRGEHTQRLQAAWDKCGANEFFFRILEVVDDKEKLIPREQFWIDKFASYDEDCGFNTRPTADASSGFIPSWETRQKMSAARKGIKFTEEHCRKISLGNKGKVRTEEMKEWQRQLKKGRVMPEETKQKIRESCKGINTYKRSEETKRKLSEARKGMPPSHCKFQPDEVLEIERRIRDGETCRSIAKEKGVSKNTIQNIKNHNYYKRILEAK